MKLQGETHVDNQMWDWMDEDVLNVYSAMELEKGLVIM